MPDAVPTEAPVHVPLPYSINPLSLGIQLGLAGASAGLGYAALNRAIKLRAGDTNPVSVAKPILVGSLIGTALGAVAGWKYGDQTMANPYPQTWEGLDQSIRDRVDRWPKFAGLTRLVEKRAQQVWDQSNYDAMPWYGQVGMSMIPGYGLKYDINQVGTDIGNMRSSWNTGHPGEAIGWGVTGLADSVLGILGQIPGASLVTKGGKLLARGGKILTTASRAARPMAAQGGKQLAQRAAGTAMQGAGKAMNVAGNVLQSGKSIPGLRAASRFAEAHPGINIAGQLGYGALKSVTPYGADYMTENQRSLADMMQEQAKAPQTPAQTGGQTANVPQYNYGESNAQPGGYGYMEKAQSTKYAGLLSLVEKRAQDGQSMLGSLANAGMYLLPGVGTAMSAGDTLSGVQDVIDRVRAGQYGRAALSGLGTLGNAAITALTLAPGGGFLARLARGMRMRKAVPGVAASLGHAVGKHLPDMPRSALSKLLGTVGNTMVTKSPPKSWTPYLTWGGIPASVVGGMGPGLLDIAESRQAKPPVEAPGPVSGGLMSWLGSNDRPVIDYDQRPDAMTSTSPLLSPALLRGLGVR